MTSVTKLRTNVLYHVAGKWDANSLYLYINGKLDNTQDRVTQNLRTSNEGLLIGALASEFVNQANMNYPLDGRIDEVRIWDVALTQAEIREWMCKKLNNTHPHWTHLQGYWRMDEDFGDIYYDLSGKGNDGTGNNTAYMSRVWSLFPIGDEAVYDIPPFQKISLASTLGDEMKMNSLAGNYTYLALIRVDEAPNYIDTPIDTLLTDHYWDIWSACDEGIYELVYTYGNYGSDLTEENLRLAYRNNSAQKYWLDSRASQDLKKDNFTLSGQTYRRQFILGAASDSVSYGNIYYIRTDGDDTKDGRSPENAWKTFSYAMTQSLVAGDSVLIAPGTYPETAMITQSGFILNPIVYSGDKTGERFGSYYTGNPGEINFGENAATILSIQKQSNLHFHHITFNSGDTLVKINNSDNLRFSQCKFVQSLDYGIYASNAGGYLDIKADTIDGISPTAIYITDSKVDIDLNIKNNNIVNCAKGIYIINSNADSICYNVISQVNYTGIYINNADICNAVCGNKITDIYQAEAIFTDGSNCKEILNNIIRRVYHTGIRSLGIGSKNTLKYISGNIIETVSAYEGIYMENVNIIAVDRNQIWDIGADGIEFQGNDQKSITRINENFIKNCGIVVEQSKGIRVENARGFVSASANTISQLYDGIYLQSIVPPGTIALVRNYIFNIRGGSGVYINNIGNCLFKNNIIYFADTGYENTSHGITINSNSSYFVDIINNTIYQSGQYGIDGASNNLAGNWKNNIIVGHTVAGIISNGSPKIYNSYNCVWNNSSNYIKLSAGPGSFSSDPLFVDPDGDDNVLAGDNWQDDNLNIKSTFGSYHFGSWTQDDTISPCLDTGDPNDDIGFEPEDNGDCINIGAWGGTGRASLSGPYDLTVCYNRFPDSVWVLLGVPVLPNISSPLAVYGDDFGGKMPYEGNNWSMIRWTTEDSVSEYYEYGDGTIYQPPDPAPGIGHFIWQNYAPSVDIDVMGRPLSEDLVLPVAQAPNVDWLPPALGYNMFANPYRFIIDWSNSLVIDKDAGPLGMEMTLTSAADQSIISPYAYIWNHEAGQYEIITPQEYSSSDSLANWQGFWFIQFDSTTNLGLKIPYQKILAKSTEASSKSIEISKFGMNYKFRASSVMSNWNWFCKFGVVSSDFMLQDMENGIGVSQKSVDIRDGWDAPDMGKIGEYVQLSFKHADKSIYAYDLHQDFETSSIWNAQVTSTTTKTDQEFYLLWPHIRLVPQFIKISLLDESEQILLDDIRASRGHPFTLDGESPHNFILKAEKVEDKTAPDFYFALTQNIFLPDEITLYIIPSEPLADISALANNQEVVLKPIDSPPNIYYFTYRLTGEKSLNLSVSGIDISGNRRTKTEQLQTALVKTTVLTKLEDTRSGYELSIPEKALKKESRVLFGQCAMNLVIPLDMEALDEALIVYPEKMVFNKPVRLRLPENRKYRDEALYQYKNGEWRFVTKASPEVTISEGGVYQLFKSVAEKDKIPIENEFKLGAVYPNPFNSTAQISYVISWESDVAIQIYDLRGFLVKEFKPGFMKAGEYKTTWNGYNNQGSEVASGIYFIVLNSTLRDGKLKRDIKKATYLK